VRRSCGAWITGGGNPGSGNVGTLPPPAHLPGKGSVDPCEGTTRKIRGRPRGLTGALAPSTLAPNQPLEREPGAPTIAFTFRQTPGALPLKNGPRQLFRWPAPTPQYPLPIDARRDARGRCQVRRAAPLAPPLVLAGQRDLLRCGRLLPPGSGTGPRLSPCPPLRRHDWVPSLVCSARGARERGRLHRPSDRKRGLQVPGAF
jgi:hypothetical protein